MISIILVVPFSVISLKIKIRGLVHATSAKYFHLPAWYLQTSSFSVCFCTAKAKSNYGDIYVTDI